MSTAAPATGTKDGIVRLLVLCEPTSPEVTVLKGLPSNVQVLALGRTQQDLAHLTDEQWASIDVLLNCGMPQKVPGQVQLSDLWPRLTGLRWMHSTAAGLEHILFPALVDGPVTLTNAKGVYSHSLAEWALAGCSWFAKDLPRLVRQKAERNYLSYEVEELRGKTMGIIGYGDIGQATAGIARAYKMRVVAMRRRTDLSAEERSSGLVDALFSPADLALMVAECDYLVAALPHTPATHEIVSRAVVAAMRPNAVFVNVGRGKCVDEPALIEALQAGRIRGAALDVTFTEPLPADNPLWGLENVLLSPHCADRTKEFQYQSLELFIQNANRFGTGEPLLNVVDKKIGY